jgi:hypothetical protein
MKRDELDLLGAANPVPGVGAPRLPLRRSRLAVLAAGVVALVLVAAPALGLGIPSLDFRHAEHAPAPVERDFDTLGVGAPEGMDPGVIPGETRKVATFHLPSGGTRTLWVAPTRSGGLCDLFSDLGGGCDKLGTVPLSASWGGGPMGDDISRVAGFVRDRWSASVQIELDDGTLVVPRVVWVSDPIGAGFFLYEPPAGRSVSLVRALDSGGNVVTEQRPGGEDPVPPPDALQDEKTPAYEIETEHGPAQVWFAPTRYDGRCAWIEFEGQLFPGHPCFPHGYEHQTGLAVGFLRTPDAVLLRGWVGDAVDRAELEFADGETSIAQARDNVILADVPSSRFAPGHQLLNVRYLRADGSVIVDIPTLIGAGACFVPLPQHDATCDPGPQLPLER